MSRGDSVANIRPWVLLGNKLSRQRRNVPPLRRHSESSVFHDSSSTWFGTSSAAQVLCPVQTGCFFNLQVPDYGCGADGAEATRVVVVNPDATGWVPQPGDISRQSMPWVASIQISSTMYARRSAQNTTPLNSSLSTYHTVNSHFRTESFRKMTPARRYDTWHMQESEGVDRGRRDNS